MIASGRVARVGVAVWQRGGGRFWNPWHGQRLIWYGSISGEMRVSTSGRGGGGMSSSRPALHLYPQAPHAALAVVNSLLHSVGPVRLPATARDGFLQALRVAAAVWPSLASSKLALPLPLDAAAAVTVLDVASRLQFDGAPAEVAILAWTVGAAAVRAAATAAVREAEAEVAAHAQAKAKAPANVQGASGPSASAGGRLDAAPSPVRRLLLVLAARALTVCHSASRGLSDGVSRRASLAAALWHGGDDPVGAALGAAGHAWAIDSASALEGLLTLSGASDGVAPATCGWTDTARASTVGIAWTGRAIERLRGRDGKLRVAAMRLLAWVHSDAPALQIALAAETAAADMENYRTRLRHLERFVLQTRATPLPGHLATVPAMLLLGTRVPASATCTLCTNAYSVRMRWAVVGDRGRAGGGGCAFDAQAPSPFRSSLCGRRRLTSWERCAKSETTSSTRRSGLVSWSCATLVWQ